MKAQLVPPDTQRCQCEIRPAHGPFVLGPRPRLERCPNPPEFLAEEVAPGADGQKGSMSLCAGCAQELLKNPKLRLNVQLTPLKKPTKTKGENLG